MNKQKVVLGFAVLLGLLVIVAPSSPAVDLTGTWTGSVDTGNMGVDTLTLVLKKAAQSYTGILNDSLGLIDKDSAIAEVKLVGNEFSFSFKAIGGAVEFAMKLTVNGEKMTGQLINKAEDQGTSFEFARKK